MEEIFSLTTLRFRFRGNIEVKDVVEIKVKNLSWDAIFKTLLESYGLKYRFVHSKLIEIYRQKRNRKSEAI